VVRKVLPRMRGKNPFNHAWETMKGLFLDRQPTGAGIQQGGGDLGETNNHSTSVVSQTVIVERGRIETGISPWESGRGQGKCCRCLGD